MPKAAEPIPVDLVTPEWFQQRVAIDEATGCHVWTGTEAHNGYGRLAAGGKRWYAHRVSLALAGHEVSPDLVVDHLCRNHSCVNPEHLELVTQAVNILRGASPSAYAMRSRANGVCRNGHVLTEVGTHKSGACAECGREKTRRYYSRSALRGSAVSA